MRVALAVRLWYHQSMKICTVDGCDKKHNAKGWCVKHYHRFLKHGDPTVGGFTPRLTACSVSDCERGGKIVLGFCTHHHHLATVHGDVHKTPSRRTVTRSATLADRIQAGTPQGLPEDACWEWEHYRDKKNYGFFKFRGKAYLAHRAAYTVSIDQELSSDIVVRHKCDNPPCVNPSHLEHGTQADNVQDAMTRGRHVRGASVSSSKLTEASVRRIREQYAEGVPVSTLAAEYGVVAYTIRRVIHRQTWAHLE